MIGVFVVLVVCRIIEAAPIHVRSFIDLLPEVWFSGRFVHDRGDLRELVLSRAQTVFSRSKASQSFSSPSFRTSNARFRNFSRAVSSSLSRLRRRRFPATVSASASCRPLSAMRVIFAVDELEGEPVSCEHPVDLIGKLDAAGFLVELEVIVPEKPVEVIRLGQGDVHRTRIRADRKPGGLPAPYRRHALANPPAT